MNARLAWELMKHGMDDQRIRHQKVAVLSVVPHFHGSIDYLSEAGQQYVADSPHGIPHAREIRSLGNKPVELWITRTDEVDVII